MFVIIPQPKKSEDKLRPFIYSIIKFSVTMPKAAYSHPFYFSGYFSVRPFTIAFAFSAAASPSFNITAIASAI